MNLPFRGDFDKADVTIVGSGPAGITTALECLRYGKTVRLLESGGHFPTAEAQDLSSCSFIDPARHDDMSIAVARRFGGTSNLWGARCQPLDPVDFEARDLVAARWPISRNDILPFYEVACKYASCGKPVFSSVFTGRELDGGAVDPFRLERFSNSPAFQVAHKNALVSSSSFDLRLNATVIDFVLGENGRVCELIVAEADGKRVIPVNDVVVACGGLESTRLLLVLQRKHQDLFGGPSGPLGRHYMGHVIGEIADITFSSEDFVRAYDFFVDSNGSYARRRMILSNQALLQHQLLNCAFWPVVPPVSDARHGSSILSSVYLAFAIPPIGRALVAEAIRKRHVPAGVSNLPHLRNLLCDLPRAMGYLPSFFYKRYASQMRLPGFFVRNPGRRYGLSYHQEQIPDSSSRVWLNEDCDRLGVPKLTVDLRFCAENADSLVRSHALLADWLEKSGVATLQFRHPKEELVNAILAQASHGTHQIGTARMGTNRVSGVVDGNLATFDIPNLYVASSAVMPTSGQANPTLTIVALAARLAKYLATGNRSTSLAVGPI